MVFDWRDTFEKLKSLLVKFITVVAVGRLIKKIRKQTSFLTFNAGVLKM